MNLTLFHGGMIMRLLGLKNVVWIGFLTALVAFGVTSRAQTAPAGKGCTKGPCAFYEDNESYPGSCGSLKEDKKNCYCIKIGDNSKYQRQLACSKQ
jgi:hypothetical protein